MAFHQAVARSKDRASVCNLILLRHLQCIRYMASHTCFASLSVKDFGLNFQIFKKDFLLLGIPEIKMELGDIETCQGDDAVILTVKTTLKKALIPFLNDLKDGLWFGNFDGTVLAEDTQWVLEDDRDNTESIVMKLPRAAIEFQDLFEIVPGASVILRATPEILPFPPKSMFAKALLDEIFADSFTAFECCEDEDCVTKLGDPTPEEERFCDADNDCDVRALNRRNLRN